MNIGFLMAIRYALTLMLLFYCCRALPVSVEISSKGTTVLFDGYHDQKGAWVFNPDGKKRISMATLDWMPYIGENICGQGWVQQVIVAMFIEQGYRVESYFLPWKRAVAMVERGELDVLYPEYFIPSDAFSDIVDGASRRDLLKLSEPFAESLVTLIKRSNYAFDFSGGLPQLKGESIGVVAGYENSAEFDELMMQGYFYVSLAVDDFTNVRKLLRERVNLIVADPTVAKYNYNTIIAGSEGKNMPWEIVPLTPALTTQQLYLAFSTKRAGYGKHLQLINREIRKMKSSDRLTKIKKRWLSKSDLDSRCKSDYQRNN